MFSSEILDRLPPQSIQDERAVLGCILSDPKVLDGVAGIIQPSDFYADAHQRLFSAMLALDLVGKPIDVEILRDHLKTSGEYEAIGGDGNIGEIAQAVPFAVHWKYYAEIVARHSRMRRIIHVGTDMLRKAWDPGCTPEEVLNDTERCLTEIATSNYSNVLVDSETAMIACMERIDQSAGRRDGAGIFTGLERFDTEIGGLFPSEFNVISARSGVGKSSLACQIVAHNASRGRLVYVASLEMDAADLQMKMLCTAAKVNGRKIRTGFLTLDERTRLVNHCAELAKRTIRFDERPEITVSDIRRSCRRLMKDGLALAVVDYLQIVQAEGDDETREREIATISRRFKALSRELKIPVLVLCQSNRDAEKDKTASLRHLRESDAIGQNADVVLILETGQIGTDTEREGWLTVLKNRLGPKGKIQLDWCPEYTEFTCHNKGAAEFENYEVDFQGDF